MLKVDIFVNPSLFYFPTSRYFWDIHWFPVWFFRREIKKTGINIRFKSMRSFSYDKMGDIIFFSSYFFFSNKGNYTYKFYQPRVPLKCFEELKKREKRIIWFDMEDGSGSIHHQLLDFVDKYYKKQILKDLSLYNKKPWVLSYHTDFYSRKYNFKALEESIPQPIYHLKNKYKNKIGLSWNYALHDYRSLGRSKLAYSISKLNDYKINLKYKAPRKINEYELSARFSPRNFQRKKLLEFVRESFPKKKIGMGYLNRNLYFKELQNTDAVLSPFGYGEPCFRDIETFIAGAALIKPNMDHIKTWPDLYHDQETYIAIPWEIEKWKETIPNILNNKNLLYEVAKNGQNMFKKIWEKKGILEFVNHFRSLILDC